MCSKRHHSPHQQYVFVILKFPPSKYFPSPAICTCHVKFPLSRYSKFPLSRYGTASHQQYALVILKFPLSKYISPAICTCHVKIPTKYFPSPAICTCHVKIPTKYFPSPAICTCHVKIPTKYFPSPAICTCHVKIPTKYFPSPAICTCHVKIPTKYFPSPAICTCHVKIPTKYFPSPAICTCHFKIPTKYFPSPAICTCHFKIPTKYLSPAIYNCHVKILIKYMCSHLWPYLAAIYTSQMRSDHRRRLRSICQTGYAPVCPRTTGCCHTPHIALTSSCWHPEKKEEKNHYAISNVYFFWTPQPTPSVSNNNAHTQKWKVPPSPQILSSLTTVENWFHCRWVTDLGKGELADNVAIGDGHFSVLVSPALTTQQVVNACGHLVPLVVVSVPEKSNKVERLLKAMCACVCVCVCVCVCMGEGGWSWWWWKGWWGRGCMHVCEGVNMHVCVCLWGGGMRGDGVGGGGRGVVCMCVRVWTCMRVCMCMCLHKRLREVSPITYCISKFEAHPCTHT